MVLLPINGIGQPKEWVTLEFQGDIECHEQQKAGETFQIGSMCASSLKKDVVELTIGYHQLEGQSVPLKKPLAMLEKAEKQDSVDSQAAGYQVVGIIRKKIVFKARPRALISKPSTR